jgi:hypothetical protein
MPLFSDEPKDGEGRDAGMKMRCLECGSEQAADAGKCDRCGAPIAVGPARPAVTITGRRGELRMDERGVRVKNS